MGKQQLGIRICHTPRPNTNFVGFFFFFWFATDRWNNSIISLGKGSPELFSPLYIQNVKTQRDGTWEGNVSLKSNVLSQSLFSLKSGNKDWWKMFLCFLLEGQPFSFWESGFPQEDQPSLPFRRPAAGEAPSELSYKYMSAQHHLKDLNFALPTGISQWI